MLRQAGVHIDLAPAADAEPLLDCLHGQGLLLGLKLTLKQATTLDGHG